MLETYRNVSKSLIMFLKNMSKYGNMSKCKMYLNVDMSSSKISVFKNFALYICITRLKYPIPKLLSKKVDIL